MPASFTAYVFVTTLLQCLLTLGCVTMTTAKSWLDRAVLALWAGLAGWGFAILWGAL